jgi:MFS family permease
VKLLYLSAILTLIALGLMVWSLFEPTPLPVMVAMSVGQGLGTAAFGAYGYVVVKDILKVRRARRDTR